MKKGLCVLLSILFCMLSLSACASRGAVSVNGTPIEKGVVLYFFDAARQEAPDAGEEEISASAHKKISAYVAVNSAFQERGLSLTTAEKAQISQNVNALWRLFGTYYTELGVSKQDLMKIETSKGYKDAVLADYYAPDGDKPVSEETLQAYFNENYIAFKSITGFLTTADNDGNPTPLTDTEKTKLRTVFENAAAAINAGSSVAEQAEKLENIIANTETVVVNRGDSNYPDDFFTQVSAIENGTAGAFVTGDYIFLIQRESLANEESNLFSDYRLDCLKTLKGEEFEKVLSAWAESYVVSE